MQNGDYIGVIIIYIIKNRVGIAGKIDGHVEAS
jgi:hypothetical protein